jgi:DNA polymerase III sliding clamp (beta) subunit (PCNA family)
MSSRFPKIDDTRQYSTDTRAKRIVRAVNGSTPKYQDISPEEIERRFRARLAELKQLRQMGQE